MSTRVAQITPVGQCKDALRLRRSHRLDGKGVQSIGKLGCQRLIHHPVGRHPALFPERVGNYFDTKVTFATGTVAGMSLVKMGFIDDLQ